MRSITALPRPPQEGDDSSPITSYRYAFLVKPDQIKQMNREQLLQLALEQMYILSIMVAIVRNPLAAMASRIVMVDIFLSMVEKNVKRQMQTITERSRVYISGDKGIAKKLGIHANTVSKSFKNLELYKMLKRDYTYDEEKEREYLDITLADVTTRPDRLQDKTIRKMTEAGKTKKQKGPDGAVSSSEPQLTCPSCGEATNLQVTCRGCGTTGSVEEFSEGPQGDEAVILRAQVQAALIARELQGLPQIPETPQVVEGSITPDEQKSPSQPLYTKFVEVSNNAPLSFTSVLPSPGAVIASWLEKRVGREKGARIIWATGNPTSEKKYMAKPADYQPDIRKYIKADLDHIYGSYLGRPNGTTYVLSFDFDAKEAALDAQHEDLLKQLATAGAAPIYWQRQNQRGHLELYFDTPVNANQARLWAIEKCPSLADVEEVYPALDKANSPISWPFWQRKGNTILPCTGKVLMPGGVIMTFDPTERRTLAIIVEAAVTPASLIPPAPEPEPQKPTRKPTAEQITLSFDQPAAGADIARIVIEEFNAITTWEELIDRCGGENGNGKFAAVWRGERTPSCKVDADEIRACDYGRTGDWPKKFDRYQLWCWLENVDKKADLARRCQEYRERQGIDTPRPAPAKNPAKQLVQPAIAQIVDDQAQASKETLIVTDDPAILAILADTADRQAQYNPAKPCQKCGCTFTYQMDEYRSCCNCFPMRGASAMNLYERMKPYRVTISTVKF